MSNSNTENETVQLDKDKELIIIIWRGVYDPYDLGRAYYARSDILENEDIEYMKKKTSTYVDYGEEKDRVMSILRKMEYVNVKDMKLKEGYWCRRIYHIRCNDRPNPSW